MPRKHNRTGRSKGERFLRIPHYLVYSVAWRRLSPVARAAFVEVLSLYDGSNNGKLIISARGLGDRLGRKKSTAAAALIELEASGFLATKKMASFEARNRRAAEYALTHLYDDVGHTPPSKEFMQSGMVPRPNAPFMHQAEGDGPISRTGRFN